MIRLAVFAAAAVAYAQLTGGGISGIVRDRSGGVIQHAAVRAEDRQRGLVYQAATSEDGYYHFAQLPAAVYRVTVAHAGFRDHVTDSVTVEVDSQRRLDLTLELAGGTSEITVNEPLLQVQASDSGTVTARSAIEKLPLNRRGFLNLALLTPGAQAAVQDSELSARGSFATHVNGAREEFNNFLLDGVDNNDLYTNRYVLEPPVDSIQEFKIASGGYSAEYGRSAGAQVNVVTRSGTNNWHGTAYEYFRNRALDSANFYDGGTRNKYARNQFGGVAGGPLRKDHTFVFLNADSLIERRGLTRLATVPTSAERSGDVSGRPSPVLDPFTRQPFPGNRIPAARFSRIGSRVLELFPLPNRSGTAGNYLAQPVLRERFAQGGGRLDHHYGSAGVVTFRYFYGSQSLFEPYAEDSTDVPGFGNFVDNTGHNAMLHHQHSFGARWLHSLRAGINRSSRQALPENHRLDVAALWNAPWLASLEARDRGYPFFNVQGYSAVGDATPLPLLRYTTTSQVLEDVSFFSGRHSLKFGFQARNSRANGNLDLLARGSITLSGQVTGAGIGDLLLGFPTFSLQSKLDNTQSLRTTTYAAYAQDELRLTPRLNITLGLRYEFNMPATDPYNRMAVYDPVSGRIARVGTEGISRSGIQPDRNNFAPRAGFAFHARPNLVIRGGYGLYYDAGMLVLASSYYFNPPFFTLRAFFPTATSLLSLENPFPATGGISPVSPSTLDANLSTSYLQHWSLGFERQWGSSTVASLSYTGSAGAHLIRARDPNQPRPAPGNLATRRPDPRYGSVVFIETAGNSNYHSLQASLQRRLARRLAFTGAYTLSKSIDDQSAFLGTRSDKNFPQDSSNFRAERALSSFDVPHRLSASMVVQLPAGFEARAIGIAYTGQPFTPRLRFDNSNTGNTGGNFGSDRPDVLRDPRLASRGPDRWFDTAALTPAPRFTFGNAGRNIVRGPGYASLDAALARRFRFKEHLEATIEAQAYNLLNRTNFDLPESFVDEPSTFGRIFSAKAARQVQLAIRFAF